ncbi:MAG: 30S ribosomal protein S20 [Candidatus Magasanikbacteria bacterium]|nr:30S ribosomal protein S20 [Candidatus Magasanikbacteria bacterium]
MPNLDQAKKALRKAKKAFIRNEAVREGVRKLKKAARVAVDAKDKVEATSAARNLQVALDKAAKRGIIHKNKAARLKSRLAKKLKAI